MQSLLFPLSLFLFSSLQTFHTPSLGDEEFEIPPISLDSDPSLAVSDVVGHFDDLADPSSSQDGSFSAQYGVQTLDMPVGMTHGLMEQGGGLLSGGLTMVRGKTLSGLPTLILRPDVREDINDTLFPTTFRILLISHSSGSGSPTKTSFLLNK